MTSYGIMIISKVKYNITRYSVARKTLNTNC
jgi:hypothetical protein